MASPNPLGFYSLEFPSEIERELMNGNYYAIAYLVSELAILLTRPDEDEFQFSTFFPDEADQAIENLKPSQQIALMRWATDRLEWLMAQHESNFND